MENLHALARQALVEQFQGLAQIGTAEVCTRLPGADASIPLAWHTDRPPAEALGAALSRPGPRMLGAPLVERAFLQRGHVCFLFTGEVYAAMVAHIIACMPLPPLPDPAREPADYALARALMLARQPGSGKLADRRAQEVLWLALSILDAMGRRRENRRREAGEAFVRLFQGRTPAQRLTLREELGPFGGAMARLLAYGRPESPPLQPEKITTQEDG